MRISNVACSAASLASLAVLAVFAAGCGGGGGAEPTIGTGPVAPSPPAPLPITPPPPPSAPGLFGLTTAAAFCSVEAPEGPAVLLDWSLSSGAAFYEVFRDGVPIAMLAADAHLFTDKPVDRGAAYSYFVRAINDGGIFDCPAMAVEIAADLCLPPPPPEPPPVEPPPPAPPPAPPLPPGVDVMANGHFDLGSTGWTVEGDFWIGDGDDAEGAPGLARGAVDFDGLPKVDADGQIYQDVEIPAGAMGAVLIADVNVTSDEVVDAGLERDFLVLTVENGVGDVLEQATISNLYAKPIGDYRRLVSIGLTAYAGQIVRIRFHAMSDSALPTVFRLDDVMLLVE